MNSAVSLWDRFLAAVYCVEFVGYEKFIDKYVIRDEDIMHYKFDVFTLTVISLSNEGVQKILNIINMLDEINNLDGATLFNFRCKVVFCFYIDLNNDLIYQLRENMLKFMSYIPKECVDEAKQNIFYCVGRFVYNKVNKQLGIIDIEHTPTTVICPFIYMN